MSPGRPTRELTLDTRCALVKRYRAELTMVNGDWLLAIDRTEDPSWQRPIANNQSSISLVGFNSGDRRPWLEWEIDPRDRNYPSSFRSTRRIASSMLHCVSAMRNVARSPIQSPTFCWAETTVL